MEKNMMGVMHNRYTKIFFIPDAHLSNLANWAPGNEGTTNLPCARAQFATQEKSGILARQIGPLGN